jgi:hypothetical protein
MLCFRQQTSRTRRALALKCARRRHYRERIGHLIALISRLNNQKFCAPKKNMCVRLRLTTSAKDLDPPPHAEGAQGAEEGWAFCI